MSLPHINHGSPLNQGLMFWLLSSGRPTLSPVDITGRMGVAAPTGAVSWEGGISRPGGLGSFRTPGSTAAWSVKCPTQTDGLTAMSFACWGRQSSSALARVFAKNNDTTFGLSLTTSNVSFLLNGSSLTTPSGIALNVWVHIVGTWASGDRRLFVDGVQIVSDALSTTVPTTASDITIGNRLDGARGLIGYIDDLRFWRRNLSPTEARAVYEDSRTGHPGTLVRQRRKIFGFSATSTATGTGNITLGSLGVSGAGSFTASSAGAITLGSLGAVGSGSFLASGTGSITLSPLGVAGSGTASAPGTATGVGAITLGALAVAGVGRFTATGSGSITLGSMIVAGAGTGSGGGGSSSITISAAGVSVDPDQTEPIAGDPANPFGVDPEQSSPFSLGIVNPFGIDPDRTGG
jgi:hypothetical protein